MLIYQLILIINAFLYPLVEHKETSYIFNPIGRPASEAKKKLFIEYIKLTFSMSTSAFLLIFYQK